MPHILAYPRRTRDRTIVATSQGAIALPPPANLNAPPGPEPLPARKTAP